MESTLRQVGLREDDTVDAIVQEGKLAATNSAFALHVAGGSVVTWGDPSNGGDGSAVRGQLKGVCQIQAAERAFAAIREDGTAITWGCPEFGGDSSAVREQLTCVRQIQAARQAFAAIREDGNSDHLGLSRIWR